MRSDLPSGTVTFLFTDVEGSTKLLHELGAKAYDDALIEHRRALREAFTRHGGVEVDTQGDAFFYAFPSADGALLAAGEGQAALADGPIVVRMGLHTGTPHLGQEGYVGDDVHLGARIAATSHGGQVVVSAATAELVELELTDLGEHRLKDIPQAVPIYQLGDGYFPPLKTISNTNLPRPASSFVGRERETEEVVALLRDSARLVTLSGPGGSGKTRLSIEAASELVPEFKAGVFWVGLATLRDPALVTETIAQTLGAKDGLAEHIGDREMLLLLDNLEQVIDSASELGSLLEACPNLKLLVTSRELLRIRGEVEYAVPPLSETEAVSLFCERSQLEPDETIAELCRRLDNLPLAVELAAARTSVLTPDQILERLSQRLDLLKGGRDVEARHLTLRATIEWSYELLTEDEQRLFACLSVFAGGCTLEAAEEVADADLDTLQSLVEKSLLRFSNGRYWLLETIREFAAGQVTTHAETVRRRHAEWYCDLVLRVDAELRGDHDDVLLDRMAAEHDNLRAQLAWCVDHDPILGLRTAIGMERFWWIRGHLPEERRWLADLLRRRDLVTPALVAGGLAEDAWAAVEQGGWRDAVSSGEDALRIARDIDDDDAAYKALSALAEAYGGGGRYSDAEDAYESARALARESGNRYREGATAHNQGQLAQRRGDLRRARTLTEEALAIAREVGTQEGIAGSLLALGSVLREEGSFVESLATLRIALEEVTRLGFPVKSALILLETAAVFSQTGELERGALLLGAAESVFDETGVEIDELGGHLMIDLTVALGEPVFESLRSEGREMALEEAVELALSSID
jgi:predicted ATPase